MKINETTSVAFLEEQMFGGGASWSQLKCQSNSEYLNELCFITQSSDCVTKCDCSLLTETCFIKRVDKGRMATVKDLES